MLRVFLKYACKLVKLGRYYCWNSKLTVFKIAIPFQFVIIVTGNDNAKITPIKSRVSPLIIENNKSCYTYTLLNSI